MEKRIFFPSLILTGCALSACSNVAYDYDKGTALSPSSRTFTFVSESTEPDTPVDPQTLQSAIQRELQEEGIQQGSGGSADLLVTYVFEPERELELDPPAAGRVPDAATEEAAGVASGEAYGPGTGSTVMSMQVQPSDTILRPAQLTIEVQDAQTQEMVWRASALMDLQEDDPEAERTALIDEVVTQMFEKFPSQ